MVFGLFSKKKSPIQVLSPMAGEVKPIDQAPDPVFAERMMGDGFCVFPTDGRVVSPVAGEVINLFPTLHAVGIQTADGLEVLVHVGIDTVKLQGEGFTARVKQGAKVQAGQLLLEVDLEAIKGKVPSLATPVVFTNLESREWSLEKEGIAQAGDVVATVK